MSQAQAAPQGAQISITKLINTIIGLSILIFGPFMDAPQFVFEANAKLQAMNFPIVDGMATVAISQAGWVALAAFIGALYLWITVDTFWPSIMAIAVVGLNPAYQLPAVMAQFFGNPSTFMMFFLYFFTAALIQSKVVNYVSNYILAQEKLTSKPWYLVLTLMLAMYVASWLDVISAVLMIWPVVYLILQETGHKPGDKLSTFLVGNIIGICLLASVGDIIKGPMFYINASYSMFLGNNPQLGLEPINPLSWILFTVVISICTIALILFAMRFIFKVDVSPLSKIDSATFKQNKLPPLSWKHKTLLVLLAVYVLWMILPAVLPKTPFVLWWSSKTMFGSLVLFGLLVFIKRKDDPLVNIPQISAAVPWGIFFLIGTAFFFGGIVTNPATNIPIILEMGISSALQGFNELVFTFMVIILAFVLTNLMNSIVCGIILSPVITTIAIGYGFAALPIVALFQYVLVSAILTPAAGFPGAMLYGNKEWLPGSAAAFYAIVFSAIITLVTLVVGIPLARVLF